jgi:hypothetical protein
MGGGKRAREVEQRARVWGVDCVTRRRLLSWTPISCTMSGLNINLEAITENASRLGMRIQETFSEHTRDFAVRGSSALFLDAPEDKLREIKKQLDVGTDREKLDALKRLIAVRNTMLSWT